MSQSKRRSTIKPAHDNDKNMEATTKRGDEENEANRTVSSPGYLGEDNLETGKPSEQAENQQTASAALSQQPQKTAPQIPSHMNYYNGAMPPIYQGFPYTSLPETPYKYYTHKASQPYNGPGINQRPPQDNPGGFQSAAAPPVRALSLAKTTSQPTQLMPPLPEQQQQNLQSHGNIHDQNSSQAQATDSFQISHYQPTNTFKVGRPKKADDKIAKTKFNSKFKSKIVNDRPYICSFPGCEWAFARQSDLRRHTKSHSEPSYHCPYWRNDPTCHRNGGAFNRLDVLKRHLKLVHYVQDKQQFVPGSKDDPGWCRACQRMFGNSKVFIDHCLQCAQLLTPAEWKSNDQQKSQQLRQASNNNQGIQLSQQFIPNSTSNPHADNNSIYQISDIPKINNQDSNNILQSPPPNTASSHPSNHTNDIPTSAHNENKDNDSFFLEKISNNSNQNFNVFNKHFDSEPHADTGY